MRFFNAARMEFARASEAALAPCAGACPTFAPSRGLVAQETLMSDSPGAAARQRASETLQAANRDFPCPFHPKRRRRETEWPRYDANDGQFLGPAPAPAHAVGALPVGA